MVRLVAYRDPAFHNAWVTGGMCQCSPGSGHTYGAYFVRSRVTGPGPDENELLWPVAPVWPPEVDLNEMGGPATSTSWTVHYGTGYAQIQGTRSFNMLRWHTWGVIWTPRSLTFTIDGHPWGRITNVGQIPHQAMTLDIQQETYCGHAVVNACPTHPVALQVDWVAEYRLR
jgi:beta-glucanase (GH16 family)